MDIRRKRGLLWCLGLVAVLLIEIIKVTVYLICHSADSLVNTEVLLKHASDV